MTEAQRLIPISADWILKRIQKGKKIRLKNAQINGEIDFEQVICSPITSQIQISNSKFENRLSFSGSTFIADTEFEGVTFE
jgi:hypothetical protein